MPFFSSPLTYGGRGTFMRSPWRVLKSALQLSLPMLGGSLGWIH